MKFAVNQYGLAHHYGDPAAIVRAAQPAESAGFDQFVVTDHVVMGEQVEQYPYGPWPTPLDFPWWEPMTVMGVVAGATRSLRLSTGVLLSTLRPAGYILAAMKHYQRGLLQAAAARESGRRLFPRS